MFQHSIAAGHNSSTTGKKLSSKLYKFMASHSSVWLPGSSLKKIAIIEMKHAEAITERIVQLGGEPTTKPDTVAIGKTPREMLENDREQERDAIQLYRQIIEVADKERDDATKKLFQHILSDEEKHHQLFTDLLDADQRN
ncbi:MAG: ferritin [Candidatus Aminicenantes bacterium]|nr:MAG: ferritin [Candidatus Aminicenantes bacterium]